MFNIMWSKTEIELAQQNSNACHPHFGRPKIVILFLSLYVMSLYTFGYAGRQMQIVRNRLTHNHFWLLDPLAFVTWCDGDLGSRVKLWTRERCIQIRSTFNGMSRWVLPDEFKFRSRIDLQFPHSWNPLRVLCVHAAASAPYCLKLP